MKHYNAISGAMFTRTSVPLILTFTSPLHEDWLFSQKNILEMAKDAGYETFWISNNEKMGLHDGYVVAISSTTDKQIFGYSGDDIDLVNSVKENLKDNTKQFFLIHYVGSHIPFNKRSDGKDAASISGEGLVADYERSIHHTDRALKELYNLSKSLSSTSLIYYISDHAEVTDPRGRASQKANMNIYLYEVPLIIINQTETDTDSVLTKYINPESRLISISNTSYYLAELMGYKFPDSLIKEAVQDAEWLYDANNKLHHQKVLKRE